ncbi:MAG: hypothetical protein [Caudoviricetes sp.]|nr:MAG: hypothetical protein [Caudoviricetes sp.]
MSTLIEGERYYLKSGKWENWMDAFSGVKPDSIITLTQLESDGMHLFESPTGRTICLNADKVQWYDEKSAMREIPKQEPKAESEWRLPAGTFFRVANSHTPLYLVMSNSHVFNLTEKQMHTTNSSRFKGKPLVSANVVISEVF